MKDEALKLALEALQRCADGNDDVMLTRAALDAGREALAQPVQEPVAWLSTDSIGERYLCFSEPLDNDPAQPLYAHSPLPVQHSWVGLTDDDWAKVGDMPDTFDQGVAWAAARLKEKNT